MRRILTLSIVALCVAPALAAGEAVERRLHPQPVEASSFLWTDWNRFQENYHPIYAADDDPKTAWTEGVDSSGAGEWIRFHVTPMEGATRARLSMRAGYQKSPGLFKANARPREVTVKLLPGGTTSRATLEDRQGWQEIVIEQPAGKLDAVEVRVDSVYEGTRYTDLCISDVRLFVTATTRDNPAFEKSKFEQIKAWKAERLRAARLFKKKEGKALPILPSYRLASHGRGSFDAWSVCGKPLCWLEKSLAKARADTSLRERFREALSWVERAAREPKAFVPVKLVARDKRPIPGVDGLNVTALWQAVEYAYGYDGIELPMVGVVGAFRADKLGAFEIKRKQDLTAALEGSPRPCRRGSGRTYTWALKEKPEGAKERLRALLVVRCGMVEMRDGEDDASLLQVMVYDHDGRLAVVAGPGYVSGFDWAEVDGHEVVVGARAVYLDGRTHELTRPAVASTP